MGCDAGRSASDSVRSGGFDCCCGSDGTDSHLLSQRSPYDHMTSCIISSRWTETTIYYTRYGIRDVYPAVTTWTHMLNGMLDRSVRLSGAAGAVWLCISISSRDLLYAVNDNIMLRWW